MSYETLKVERDGPIVHVILNRPDKRNAMNPAFWRELRALFEGLSEDVKARVAVISSTGPHFSSGLDLQEFSGLLLGAGGGCEGRKREALRRFILQLQASFSALEACPIPVLAAIQGGCIGGGVDMVSACDMRYCTADGWFVIKEIDLGMTADVGTLQRLPKLIPDGLMRELAYTGREMKADEAKALGLVNRVFDDQESMLAEVMTIAETIASKSPLAIRGSKEMLNYARDHRVVDGLNYVATWNAGVLLSNDLLEAFQARMEKRAPRFADLDAAPDLG